MDGRGTVPATHLGLMKQAYHPVRLRLLRSEMQNYVGRLTEMKLRLLFDCVSNGGTLTSSLGELDLEELVQVGRPLLQHVLAPQQQMEGLVDGVRALAHALPGQDRPKNCHNYVGNRRQFTSHLNTSA